MLKERNIIGETDQEAWRMKGAGKGEEESEKREEGQRWEEFAFFISISSFLITSAVTKHPSRGWL